jgi:DNA-binding NtrC family response regulator
MDASVLIVEDEKHMAVTLSTLLSPEYQTSVAETGKEGVNAAKSNPVDIVLLDLMLPDISGIEVLKRLKNLDPIPEVIVITAVREVKTAVDAMKLGAFDYIEKPFESEELLLTIAKALEKQRLSREVGGLRAELADAYGHENIVGESQGIHQVLAFIAKVRDMDCNVLLLGETGTGKELAARAIHYTGNRKHCPFVPVNCASLPENMLDSELFGHEKGAFTGAERRRRGKIELAHTGTLFLDEIGSMSLPTQAKLLRVIELKEFERLGGERTLRSDFRVVAASNADLEAAMKDKKFRTDLYYRLNVAHTTIPSLRERRSDIPLLVEHFLKRHNRKTGMQMKSVTDQAMNQLISFDWPGNVRQLQNVLENALVMEDGETLSGSHFPGASEGKQGEDSRETRVVEFDASASLNEAVGAFEAVLVREALEKCAWDRKKAAELLGVHLNTVKNKIAKYNISKPR